MSRKSSRKMAAHEDPQVQVQRKVKTAFRQEQQLLNAELAAEKDVLKARTKLVKAAERLAKRQARLLNAEQVLTRCQNDRVAGPQMATAES